MQWDRRIFVCRMGGSVFVCVYGCKFVCVEGCKFVCKMGGSLCGVWLEISVFDRWKF